MSNEINKLRNWMEAQKRHRLSDKQVQMARELGLNPQKLGKIDNHKQEPWKAPLPEFIEKIYFRRFKKNEPSVIKPVRELLAAKDRKKAQARQDKAQARAQAKALEKAQAEASEKAQAEAPENAQAKAREKGQGSGAKSPAPQRPANSGANARDGAQVSSDAPRVLPSPSTSSGLTPEGAQVSSDAPRVPCVPYKLAVLVFIENAAGEQLLIHRAKSPNLGAWSPIGGKLETAIGESPYECAVRETREETGFEITTADLHLFCMIAEKSYEGGGHWLLFLFRCKNPIPALPPDIEEGTFGFFSRAAMDAINIPETDRSALWPIFDNHRDRFVTLNVDCAPANPLRVVTEEIF